VNLALARSKGFAFLFEFNYLCHRSGKVFREVPIKFVDRQAGESKLSLKIVLEALIMVLRLWLSGSRGGTLSGARP
jgi:dolichol-phosphate mannosyltransferase